MQLQYMHLNYIEMKVSQFDKTRFALGEIKTQRANHVERTKKYRRKKIQQALRRYFKNLEKE